MVTLLICRRGLYGEALEQLIRELDPGVEVRVMEGSAHEVASFGGEGSPHLVVADFDCLRADPASAVMMIRHHAPGARLVVLGGTEQEGVSGSWGGDDVVRTISKDATGDEIAKALHRILDEERAEAAHPDDEAAAPAAAESTYLVAREPVPTLGSLGLTHAEIEVLAWIAQGLSNHEIALRRGRAIGTVRAQVAAILRKLKVRNRREAMVIATRIVAVVGVGIDTGEERPLDIAGLLPHMKHRRFKQGTVLFRKGDYSDCLYLIQKGKIRLPEFNAVLGQHDTLGEIGVFSPDHRRTCSAVCDTDVDLFELDAEKVRQAYIVHPGFALHILNKISERMLADRVRAA